MSKTSLLLLPSSSHDARIIIIVIIIHLLGMLKICMSLIQYSDGHAGFSILSHPYPTDSKVSPPYYYYCSTRATFLCHMKKTLLSMHSKNEFEQEQDYPFHHPEDDSSSSSSYYDGTLTRQEIQKQYHDVAFIQSCIQKQQQESSSLQPLKTKEELLTMSDIEYISCIVNERAQERNQGNYFIADQIRLYLESLCYTTTTPTPIDSNICLSKVKRPWVLK